MDSPFQIASCECPDINANTMALDITGRYAIVSGRKSMILVDLDGEDAYADGCPEGHHNIIADNQSSLAPKKAPIVKKMARNSKYEPTASQFNRHLTDLFAITTYQTAEIFSVNDLNPTKPKLVLKGHSRAIADIEWSHFDPYLLGSSAADCLTNLWDIRGNRRPLATLTSVSGATQVRFSKTSSNLIATSHEIDVRIWDIRQPNLPLYYIAAHLQKINGMDWNPCKTNCDQEQLITSSQDNTIKLWDLNTNKIKPSANLQTRTPAWRIRYSPISSNAILTSTLPQLRSRSECTSLKFWFMKPNRFEQKKLELILSLDGHKDVIVDFDWRVRPSTSNCEIVSWSKDQTLRIWRIDNQLTEMNLEVSDFENESEIASEACEPSLISSKQDSGRPSQVRSPVEQKHSDPIDSAESTLKPSRYTREKNIELDAGDSDNNASDAENLPTTELKQEFNLINKNIPNIEFEELNSLRRVCLVTARAKSLSCRLRIALPPAYPQFESPVFTIIDSNQYGSINLNRESKEKLLHLLDETAKSQLTRSRNCIEPCLRKFIAALQKLASHNSHKKRPGCLSIDGKDDPITLSAQRDHSVPFPTTCGARFCGNLLVCFGRPLISIANSSTTSDAGAWSVETPRSMAQLSAQLDNLRRQGSYNLTNISISYFYYGAMRRADFQNRNSKIASNERTGSKNATGRSRSSAFHGQTILSKNYKCGPVIVYEISNALGGICPVLAENYVFDKDVISMCRRNAEIAASYQRKDLIQIWSLAELSSEGILHSYVPNKEDEQTFSLIHSDSDFGDRPWTLHPFGSKLIQSLVDHYVNNCRDVQTAAMLVWTFSSSKLGLSNKSQSHYRSQTNISKNSCTENTAISSHQTIMQAMLSGNKANMDALSDDWNLVGGPEAQLYSNSWSNSTIYDQLMNNSQSQDQKSSMKTRNPSNISYEERFPKLNILSPERSLQNDLIMHIYAEVLYRLNLLNQRAMILKNIGTNSAYSDIFCNQKTSNEPLNYRLPNLIIQCYNPNCGTQCKSAQCPNCKKYSLYCSICRLPVKGSSSICIKCLHGGHVNHFSTWFNEYDFCPTGCGCRCLSAEY